jgi:hypothetical protein
MHEQPNPTDILAQKRAEADQAEREAVAAARRDEGLYLAMRERWGRDLVRDLLRPLFEPSYRADADNRFDPYAAAFAEGQRWEAGRLWTRLRGHCPELLHQLLGEDLLSDRDRSPADDG